MDTRSYWPTFPNSFFLMGVGDHFFSLDVAGLTGRPTPIVAIRVERKERDLWFIDTYREHPDSSHKKRIRVDRWPVRSTDSGTMVRASSRTFPPDEVARPEASGHYPRELPREVLELLRRPLDVSSRHVIATTL